MDHVGKEEMQKWSDKLTEKILQQNLSFCCILKVNLVITEPSFSH